MSASSTGLPDLAAITRMLRDRRRTLAGELEQLTAPPEAGAAVSFGKRIGDGTTEAVERIHRTAAARTLAAAMAETDRALAKLAEGTYGVCDECGVAISPARMAARPATAHCVACRRTA